MIYIILALFLYTAVTLLGTTASRHANTNLVTVIQTLTSGIITLLIVGPSFDKKTIQTQKFGLLMAVLCGVAIGLFTLALVKSFSENKVGIVAPIVLGGSIFLSTILSYFIFKEKLTPLEVSGLSIMGIGLTLLIYTRATTK